MTIGEIWVSVYMVVMVVATIGAMWIIHNELNK